MFNNLTEQEQIRLEKLAKLKKLGVLPFGEKQEVNTSTLEILKKYKDFSKEELESKDDELKIIGRIMTKRGQGRAGFITIQDSYSRVQVYVRADKIGEDNFEVFSLSDIGDIVYIVGNPMKTKTGELTIKCTKFVHLTKSLKPLPDKHHGLLNIEERYRRRYVDLIVNPEVKNNFINRSIIISEIRSFCNNLGYLEVETPMLHPILGGASAEPFKTYHNTLKREFYLRVAPELYLKRLIVGGFEGVYEIGKLFRNEGVSVKHNPEFTSMEIYIKNEDMTGMMNFTEKLIKHVCQKMKLPGTITYNDQKITWDKDWDRITMANLVKKYANVDFSLIKTSNEALSIAEKHKVHVENHQKTIGHILNLFFEEFVEDKLINPTFVYSYPKDISPLAKESKDNPEFTDRFELFIGGREYANAFSELNDPIDQYERFKKQLEEKEKGNKEASEMDKDYVESLMYGMPPTGGLGVGVDRLIMLLTNSYSIRDIILFPHMKDKNNQ